MFSTIVVPKFKRIIVVLKSNKKPEFDNLNDKSDIVHGSSFKWWNSAY